MTSWNWARCPRRSRAARRRRPLPAEPPDLGWNWDGQDDAPERPCRSNPDGDRIIVIEETAEIHLPRPNVLRLEARRAQSPLGQEAPVPPVTISDLLRAALRHRPDRILVGEVRGAEAFDLLQALNTGHLGSLSTIHANSAEQAPDTAGSLCPDRERRFATSQRP